MNAVITPVAPFARQSVLRFLVFLIGLIAVSGLVFGASVGASALGTSTAVDASAATDSAVTDSAATDSAANATAVDAQATALPHPAPQADARHRQATTARGAFAAPVVTAAAPPPAAADARPRSSAAPFLSSVLTLLLSVNRT